MNKMKCSKKAVALTLASVMLIGGVGGNTLAWLLDDGGKVTNTFVESNINITLTETDTDTNKTGIQHDYKMIPGWTIPKDPKITVVDGSEDCWVFVKITESTTPDLDAYISYGIESGWTKIDSVSTDDVIVVGRKVYKDDTTKTFSVIGYTGTDNVFVADQVLVKDTVDMDAMNAISGNKTKPTLTFEAYAVQLYKTNDDGDKANTDDEFNIEVAWEKAAAMNSGN